MFKTIARMRDHQDARRCRVAAGEGKDGGFSLVELLVVVVIIAILSAIAIPIFLNQRNKAYKATAQADGRTVAMLLTSAFSEYPSWTANTTGVAPSGTAPNYTTVTVGGVTAPLESLSAGSTMGVVKTPTTTTWCTSVTNNGQTAYYNQNGLTTAC